MAALRVGLLELDHVEGRNLDVAGDYSDMFAALLEPHGIDLVSYDVVGGTIPDDADECAAWVTTGSRHSVGEPEPWIEPTAGFVRDLHAASLPFVGICFGHQLIAHALGGRVERAGGWGVGAHDVEIVAAQPWMDPPHANASLLFMHQDQVSELPEGAQVVASTVHCPIASLRVGSLVGIQAHPEFVAPYVERLLDERVDRIGVAATERARSSLASERFVRDSAIVGSWMAHHLRGAPRTHVAR